MQQAKFSEPKPLPRIILLFLLIAVLSACGTITKVDDTKVSGTTKSTTVSGYVVESDGVTPVYGATVAVLSNKLEIKPSVQHAEISHPCVSPAKPNINFVCSMEDGSFSLDLSQVREFPVTISIENQDDIQEITLELSDLNSDLGTIAMAAGAGKTKDKVAVVMDFYNPIKEIQQYLGDNSPETQDVALQLMSEYRHLFKIDSNDSDISYPTFYSLFTDADNDGKADIFKYDVVYINSRQQSDIGLLDQSLRKQLLSYISNGGNLFITEWTVELEQEEEPSLDQYI